MRIVVALILTTALNNLTFSQKLIGSISQPYDFSIEACEAGDSVLVCLTQTGQLASPLSDLYWISESRVQDFGQLKKFKKEELVGVDANKGRVFLYSKVGKKKNDNLLIRRNLTSIDAELNELSELSLPGVIIGSFKEDLLNIIVVDKKASVLKFVSFDGDKQISEKLVRIPFNLSKFKNSDFAFVDSKVGLTHAHSYARVKFFKLDSELILILDEPFQDFVENQSPPYRTAFFRYNLRTDETESKVFFEMNNYYFRSFMIENFLLRVAFTKEGLRVSSFDLASQKQIQEIFLTRDLPDLMGYQRNSRDFKITKGKMQNLKINLGSDQWSPVIIAEKIQNSEVVISVGLYSDAKGAFVVVPGGPIGLAAGLIATSVGTAIMQSQEKPAISNYTYLSMNEMGNISQFGPNANYFRMNIDDYESTNLPVLRFKGYAETHNWKAALYWSEGVKQIDVRIFNKN